MTTLQERLRAAAMSPDAFDLPDLMREAADALDERERWRELADRAARLWRRPSGHGAGEALNWLDDYDALLTPREARP